MLRNTERTVIIQVKVMLISILHIGAVKMFTFMDLITANNSCTTNFILL